MSIKVTEIEIAGQIEPVQKRDEDDAMWILVRHHGRPLGRVIIANSQETVIPSGQIREAILAQLGRELTKAAFRSRIDTRVSARTGDHAFVEDVPRVAISVVVCTRDRTDQLERCLESLLALDYDDYEIVVVDNAPRDDATARLAARLPIRYVREDRPGLDWARNRGVAEARHGIIAFTDDDARPDPLWLRAIAQAFSDERVAAVTGFVAPAELETEAQILFEMVYGGMSHGFRRRTISGDSLAPRELLWASAFGVGANMAFRRAAFGAVGMFDTALDVGTPSGGGGDVEMFHRLVARGHMLVYDPAALVWHTHRRDLASLRRLIYSNGRSFVCYLLTCARNRTMSRRTLLRVAAREWVGWWLLRRLRRSGDFPRRLVLTEIAGVVSGPLAYRAARKQAKRLATKYRDDTVTTIPVTTTSNAPPPAGS